MMKQAQTIFMLHLSKFYHKHKLNLHMLKLNLDQGNQKWKKKLTNCNDLFSRFEQQTSILEKLAETTDPTTDRHGHDGLSRGSRFKTLRKSEIGY